MVRLGAIIATGFAVVTASGQSTPMQPTAVQQNDPKPQKTYELRIYVTNPGKLPDLQARFREHTMKLFEKHGMENVIYWTLAEDFGEESKDNTLIYILAHKSREAADASWAAFRADPEWQAVVAKSEENGRLLASAPVSVFMNPTDFHPAEWEANGNSDKPARLFELRRYGGGADSHVGRFRDWEAELFRTSGIETLGFWTTADNSAFVYLLGHPDRQTATANWQTFMAGFRGRRGRNPNPSPDPNPNPDPQVPDQTNPAQGATPSAAQADEGQAREGGRGARQGRRGGRGRGGTEVRWLIPTDYSPRK
jgi:hypothetical protein